jgi:hypothetical protein
MNLLCIPPQVSKDPACGTGCDSLLLHGNGSRKMHLFFSQALSNDECLLFFTATGGLTPELGANFSMEKHETKT